MVGAAMAALMLAMAGVAWAEGAPPCPDCPFDTWPTVVKTTPADGATGFDRDANVTAKFSEAMLKRSINRSTFRLYAGTYTDEDLNPPECPPDDPNCAPSAPPLPFGGTVTVSYNVDKKVAILNPSGRLARRTNYTAVVEGTDAFDTFSVKDQAGNNMAADYIWHFKTGRK